MTGACQEQQPGVPRTHTLSRPGRCEFQTARNAQLKLCANPQNGKRASEVYTFFFDSCPSVLANKHMGKLWPDVALQNDLFVILQAHIPWELLKPRRHHWLCQT